MAERSLEVFKQYREAQHKYDYFVVGLSLALFAYTAKNFAPSLLGFNHSTIELTSIILIFISVASGLLRIDHNVSLLANNFQKLYNLETKGKLVDALLQPGHKVNIETGEIFDPAKAQLQIQIIDECMPNIDKNINKYKKLSEVNFSIRNWSLLIGLFLLVLSLIMASYDKQ